MEETLKLILNELKGLKEGQGNLEQNVSKLQQDVSEIKETVNRIEHNQNEDVIAILKRVDRNIEARTEALNKRVYKLESEFEYLDKQ